MLLFHILFHLAAKEQLNHKNQQYREKIYDPFHDLCSTPCLRLLLMLPQINSRVPGGYAAKFLLSVSSAHVMNTCLLRISGTSGS